MLKNQESVLKGENFGESPNYWLRTTIEVLVSSSETTVAVDEVK